MTTKIRVAWSHNDDTTVRYVYIDKEVLDTYQDEAERTEFINQCIWERISEIGWDVLDEGPATAELLYVRVTWEMPSGCHEQVTYIEQEAYDACKTEADKEALIEARIGEDHKALGWAVTEVELEVLQETGEVSDTVESE